MKKAIVPLVILCAVTIAACNQGGSTTQECFKTREDSVAFAKVVMEKYAGDFKTKKASFASNDARMKAFGGAAIDAFAPIDFSRVEEYVDNYDKNPLNLDQKGFMINTTGLGLLKGNNNYKQVYLRLGKYSNSTATDDYTIMIVPLTQAGAVLHRGAGSGTIGQNSNYDYLDPCPNNCPTDFQ